MLRTCQFLTILTSKSLSRAGVVQILSTSSATDPSQLPFFGPTFASFRSDKTMEKHSISRNSYPPKHLCCENIDAARATGNFQYSRKLELLNFLWWIINFHVISILVGPRFVVFHRGTVGGCGGVSRYFTTSARSKCSRARPRKSAKSMPSWNVCFEKNGVEDGVSLSSFFQSIYWFSVIVFIMCLLYDTNICVLLILGFFLPPPFPKNMAAQASWSTSASSTMRVSSALDRGFPKPSKRRPKSS